MEQLYNFHSINNRVGIVPSTWDLFEHNLSEAELVSLVEQAGFKIIAVDVIKIARDLIGKSKYRRVANLSEAPEVFSCTSFIRWLYAQLGIELYVFAIDESKQGIEVAIGNFQAGDLVFSKGRIGQYDNDPDLGVGHVGIVTEQGTVLHNTNLHVNNQPGIAEVSFETFYKNKDNFRGARRLLPEVGFYVLEIPQTTDILWSLDVKRKIMQFLK